MKSLSLKHSILLFLITIVVLIGVIIAAIIVPFSAQILKLEKEITTTRTTFEQQFKDTRFVRRSVRELPVVTERIVEYREAEIGPEEELGLITELEKLAEKYSINQTPLVTFIDPKQIKGRGVDRHPKYEFVFTNVGTFENHLAYLKALEEFPVYFTIQSLSFEEERNSGGRGLITLRFTASVRVRE